MRNSLKPLKKYKNIRKNINMPMTFLMMNYPILSTGVVLMATILPLISETKVNVDPVTLSLLLRSWKLD
jgi:hypothetical protein